MIILLRTTAFAGTPYVKKSMKHRPGWLVEEKDDRTAFFVSFQAIVLHLFPTAIECSRWKISPTKVAQCNCAVQHGTNSLGEFPNRWRYGRNYQNPSFPPRLRKCFVFQVEPQQQQQQQQQQLTQSPSIQPSSSWDTPFGMENYVLRGVAVPPEGRTRSNSTVSAGSMGGLMTLDGMPMATKVCTLKKNSDGWERFMLERITKSFSTCARGKQTR